MALAVARLNFHNFNGLALERCLQSMGGIEANPEPKVFHLPMPYVFYAQAEQGVLAVETIQDRFHYPGKSEMDEDVVSQDVEPSGVNFIRHLEGVNECFNCRAVAEGSRSTVEP